MILLLFRFFCSLIIHIKVDSVYVGIKSPMNGMNSIVFMAVDILLFVIEYNNPVTNASNTSPRIGASNIGAAM